MSVVNRDFKCGALELEGNYSGFTLGLGVVKVWGLCCCGGCGQWTLSKRFANDIKWCTKEI